MDKPSSLHPTYYQFLISALWRMGGMGPALFQKTVGEGGQGLFTAEKAAGVPLTCTRQRTMQISPKRTNQFTNSCKAVLGFVIRNMRDIIWRDEPAQRQDSVNLWRSVKTRRLNRRQGVDSNEIQSKSCPCSVSSSSFLLNYCSRQNVSFKNLDQAVFPLHPSG